MRILKRLCSHDGCTTTIGSRNKTGFCNIHYRKKMETEGAKLKRTGSIYQISAQVSWLHRSESGVSLAKIEKGPHSYAKQLARYISDPSTIRSRTLGEWGRSPSLEVIQGFVTQWRDEREAFKAEAENLGLHESDAVDFAVMPPSDVVRFVKKVQRQKAEAAAFVEPDFAPPTPKIGRMEVTSGVAKLMKCTVDEIRGTDKARHFVRARQVVSKALRNRGLSYNQIGAWLNRDHSTIMHAIDAFDEKASDHMRWVVSQFVRQDIECEAA